MNFYYTCSECGRRYSISPNRMVCSECSKQQERGKPLRGILEVSIEGPFSETPDTSELIPIEKKYLPPIPVGGTPLWQPLRLRRKTGFPNLFIKDDTLNPTGSLKDRASFLVAAFAKKFGINKVSVASTGNAASSMAGVGAAAELDVTIYIPKTAPKAKMVQAYQYGAEVVLVDGTYDDAFDLCLQRSEPKNVLCRNTAYNPMTIEGKKTAALEIFRQLGKVPDALFVPVGDGVILGGVHKGFKDLLLAGITDSLPVLYAVQASGSCAVSRAWERGDFTKPIASETLADSIAVDIPRNGYGALKALKESKGECVIVEDSAILSAQKELSSYTGLFAEPAAAASYAGFLRIKESFQKDASIVLLITGNGLKDIDNAFKGIQRKE